MSSMGTGSRVYIKISGSDAPERITDALVSLEVDDSLTLPSMFAICLRDTHYQLIDSDTLKLGTKIEVLGDETTLLKGEVTALEPSFCRNERSFVVRGYDKSHRMHRGTRTRTYINVKYSDIARQLILDNGLSAVVDATQEVHELVLQEAQSDWDFLMQLAQGVGFWLYTKEDKTYFVKEPKGGEVALEWAVDLLEFNARMSAAHQVSEVKVRGWDSVKQEAILGSATTMDHIPGGAGKDDSGLAQKVFGTANEIIVDRPVATVREAEQLAQAILNELGQGFVQAECACIGNPGVHAGAIVDVKEVGNRFSGKYLVTHAVHRFDEEGYRTEFTLGGRYTTNLGQLLWPQRSSKTEHHGVMLGLVTNAEDPDNLRRVKVKLPMLSDDIELGWARLLAPGAGEERGLAWCPEVNDEVAVVFEHGDIHRPLVIGGLWSSKNPGPALAMDGGKVEQRKLVSRSGMKLEANDKDGESSIAIANADDTMQILIDMKEEVIKVTSKKDFTVLAEDGGVTVKAGNAAVQSTGKLTLEGKDIEIKAQNKLSLNGVSIEVHANGTLEVKGDGPAKVESSAILTLKGSLVQIN